MLNILSGPTEIFIDVLCQQDKHMQAFRLHWHMRGVEIKTNGQVFNLRGVPQYGKSLEQMAREYGR